MQQIHFDLNCEETAKMQFGKNGEVLSYTDNEIQVNTDGTSVVTLDPDGLRMGTGQFNDSGARLKYDGNISFNHAFLVVKENKQHNSANYDKVLLATHEGAINTIYNWANGMAVATNNTLNLRSVFRRLGGFLNHFLNIGANLFQRASTPTVSFAPAGGFKVVKVFLPQNNGGSKLLLGGLDGSINTTSYSQVTYKRLILASGTQAEGDVYFQDLKTQYSL